jgi:hypothetical protein
VAGCCEHGNEHLGSIECGDFLDLLSVLPDFLKTLLHGVA